MTPVAPLSATPPAEAQQLKAAGTAFEALLIQKMLASARPSAQGPEAQWRDQADRAVAETLAESSPLGVARLLEARK